MADHTPGAMLLLCHRISPRATPPDASHTPAPPCKSSSIPSDTTQHIPELSGKREVTNLILQASSAGTFWEFPSPVPTHGSPKVPADLALRLHSFSCYLYTALVVSEHVSGQAQPLLCITHYPRQSHHPQSPRNQHRPVMSLSWCVCVEVMAQKAPILPKASMAQCEWQDHGFTWCYLVIQPHIQGLFSSWVPRAAQLLSPGPLLTFSKSLQLSSPPLKTWETSLARAMADGIRLLLRGRAPPLPEHVPKRKPLLLGFISPSQPQL